MLRLSKTILAGVGSAALLSANPAFAQSGLGQRLDAQEQKLSQDEQNCREVNLAEYARLLQEASENKQRAEKAKKKGVPVDETQVNADLGRAMQLFARAQAAQARQCMMRAQGALPQTTPTPAASPPTTPSTQGEQSSIPTQQFGEDVFPENGYPADWPAPSFFEKQVADVKAAAHRGDKYWAAREAENLDYWRTAIQKYLKQAEETGIGIRVEEFRTDLKLIDDMMKIQGMSYFLLTAFGERGGDIPPLVMDHWGKREGSKEPESAKQEEKPASPPTPTEEAANLSPFAKTVLAEHNEARAAVGAPPLKWNPVLEQHAVARAQEIARIGQLVHAPREGRGTERENILSAPRGYSPGQMMNQWISEQRYFHPGIFPDVCGGDWSQCAHYTQMIWSTTTDIGCGIAPGGAFDWMVCRYNPGGNKDGKLVIDQTIRARLIGGDYTDGKPAGENDDEFWAASPGVVANLEADLDDSWFDSASQGLDSPLFYGLAGYTYYDPTTCPVYWDPVSQVTLGGGATYSDLPVAEPNYVDTKVEQPNLPPAEVFDPAAPPPSNLSDCVM